MPDNLSKEQRSYCMSRVKSKWTSPEKKMHNFLKGNKIKHKMHPKLKGNPDILLTKTRTAVFIHGCFWHGCKKCYTKPKKNRKYWETKIQKNVKRGRHSIWILKKNDFKILKIWEHQLTKDFKKTFEEVGNLSI